MLLTAGKSATGIIEQWLCVANLSEHDLGRHEGLALLQHRQVSIPSPVGVWIHIQPIPLLHHQT